MLTAPGCPWGAVAGGGLRTRLQVAAPWAGGGPPASLGRAAVGEAFPMPPCKASLLGASRTAAFPTERLRLGVISVFRNFKKT